MDAPGEGKVLDGTNFRLVALFVLCFVTILLHDFFHDCNEDCDLLQDCVEDGVKVEWEELNLSFDLEMVAFYMQTKNI